MFERELEAYRARLPELLADEGKFALIHADEVAGVFDDHECAVEAGYQRYGLVTYLVKRIERVNDPLVAPTDGRAASRPRVQFKLWQLMLLGPVAALSVWPFTEVSPTARRDLFWDLFNEFLLPLTALVGLCLVLLVLLLLSPLLAAWARRAPVTAGLLTASALSCLFWVDHSVRVQRGTVQALAAAHGAVWYDWQMDGRTDPTAALPPWVGHIADFGYLFHLSSNVISVNFDRYADDASLGLLARLGHLEAVNFELGSMGITDAGLARLAKLPSLRKLRLNGTNITDAGLVYLRSTPTLELVDLRNAPVTDAGAKGLQRALPNATIVR